jgi:hypothetical protein
MPGDREQALGDVVVDEPGELLQRHVAGLDREDRELLPEIEPVDLRLQNAFREIAANLRDRVAHIVGGAVDGRSYRELDECIRDAFANRAVDLVYAVDAAHRSFDALRHLRLKLGRGGARLRDVDRYRRKFDVRIAVHVHSHEAHHACDQKRDKQYDRGDRIADGPGGDVPEVHGNSLSLARGCAAGGYLLTGIEEGAGGKHHSFLAAKARQRRLLHARLRFHLNVAADDRIAGTDDVDIIAPLVALNRALGRSGASTEPLVTRASAKPPGTDGRIIGNRDPRFALDGSRG